MIYDKNKEGEYLAKVLWYYGLVPGLESSQHKIICPFHKDVRPSMIVDFTDGMWFCFAEQISGDAIKFVYNMEIVLGHNISELQGLKKFYEIMASDEVSGVELPNYVKARKRPNKELYLESYDYYYGLKKIDWTRSSDFLEVDECRDYMEFRGFKPETLNLCEAKYTFTSEDYPIVFPMVDNGKFKGWVCRAINLDIVEFRKYLYNEGFSRATTLVGDYGSKDYIYIVEGYMDRLKILQNGESNVVAILGWKITDEQVKKLKKKGIKRVISALDNDECGRKGTEYLKQFFEVTRFQYFKGVKDPGDMDKRAFLKMNDKTLQKFKNGGSKKNG